MKDILKLYELYCHANGLEFTNYPSVKSYDNTTLFCPAGMQQYKKLFTAKNVHKTIANNQKVLRVNDLEELGDGIHFASFNMLGLFSFKDWSIKQGIDFWFEFIEKLVGLKIEEVHIHPDKQDWKEYYKNKKVKIVEDDTCKWSDGNIGGYCTEFYINGVEIGNIVNPLGNCIDAGFGLERLEQIANNSKPKDKTLLLLETASDIAEAGYIPSNTKQGYVLRKILRELIKENVIPPNNSKLLLQEMKRQEQIKQRYLKLKIKFPNESKEWWFETHGIDLNDI